MKSILKLLACISCLLLSLKYNCQSYEERVLDTINFKLIECLKIYKFPNHKSFLETPNSELRTMSYKLIDRTEVVPILDQANPTGGTTALWSGNVYGVLFFLTGDMRKIKISAVGFRDEANHQYYDILLKDREKWNSLCQLGNRF